MKRLSLFLFFFSLKMAIWALPPLPVHALHICGVDYHIHADVYKSKNKSYYRLTIDGPVIGTKKYVLGTFDNTARESITKALRETLQTSDRFPFPNPCVPTPGGPATVTGIGEAAQNIDQLIINLIAEAFPTTHLSTVAQPINDNNILKLYLRADNSRYQLSNITPAGEVSLMSYAAPLYGVNWAVLATPSTQVIRDHFDQFILLYYLIPATAAKPALYLQFNSGTRFYEVVYSDNGHTGLLSGVLLAEDVGKKMAGDPTDNITVGAIMPRLAKVINPYMPKKSKDDAKLPEDH
jgi:hypothetical protein